jgi:hypothetical protein
MKQDLARLLRVVFLALFIFLGNLSMEAQKKQSEKSFIKEKKASQIVSDSFMHKLLAQNPQLFSSVLDPRNNHNIQVIYTRIDRTKNQKIKLTDHFLYSGTGQYFYPASTVKLPVAILALQKLNELNIPGLNRTTTMITGSAGEKLTSVTNDPSAKDGRPTIEHYIKKILLVSDNDAFNRLYEFLGQEYINNTLHKMGYTDVQVIHRLSISLSEAENRLTNPVKFLDSNGKVIYFKEAERSNLVYKPRDIKMGKGYMQGDMLVNEPFDFSKKNLLPLSDLHTIVKSIIFPQAVLKEKRFNLTKNDYAFLLKYMPMLPGESDTPVYNTTAYWDNYVKFLYYGSEKGKAENDLRIFNKVGDAYGFLIDAAYFADFKNGIEFFLSAVIYCNSDGVFNDDKYDYDSAGFPFLKNLGRVVYEYELKRMRKNKPDLSTFRFQYYE